MAGSGKLRPPVYIERREREREWERVGEEGPERAMENAKKTTSAKNSRECSFQNAKQTFDAEVKK